MLFDKNSFPGTLTSLWFRVWGLRFRFLRGHKSTFGIADAKSSILRKQVLRIGTRTYKDKSKAKIQKRYTPRKTNMETHIAPL